MKKGNPNPKRRLTPEERERGRKLGTAVRQKRRLERIAFEEAFSAACEDVLDTDARVLRIKLVAKLIAEAMSGKQWAMEKVIAYLFGQPKAEVKLDFGAITPPEELPAVPAELRAKLRELRETLGDLVHGHHSRANGHTV